jgi:formiminotetrahydrofolate cyclodeaminase
MDGKYINLPASKYLDDLAARKPTPGGGSAGALAGALAAGLLSMAVNFSIGKNPKNDKKLKTILKQSEKLRKKMGNLIDEDVQAYKNVWLAFKSLTATKAKKQSALKGAAKVPMQVAQYGAEIIKLNKKLLPICNPRLISDVASSLLLAGSAVEIGIINIKENLAIIKDKKFNKAYRDKLQRFKKFSCSIKNRKENS